MMNLDQAVEIAQEPTSDPSVMATLQAMLAFVSYFKGGVPQDIGELSFAALAARLVHDIRGTANVLGVDFDSILSASAHSSLATHNAPTLLH